MLQGAGFVRALARLHVVDTDEATEHLTIFKIICYDQFLQHKYAFETIKLLIKVTRIY